VEEPGPRDVVVEMRSAGVCHTDWEAQQGLFGEARPIVLGHEGAGVVVELGREVEGLEKGDRVVLSPFPACGACYYCAHDQPMLCEPVLRGHRNARLPDGEPRLFRDGMPVGQFLASSTFAEFAVVDAVGAIRLPADMPLDLACLLGCAVITGVGSVRNVAAVRGGDSVCVIGSGPVGLNVIQGARMAEARTIIAADPKPERRQLATRMGATHVIDPAGEDVSRAVRSLTGGRGADHSFETAGQEATLQTALDCARPGGTVTILGKIDPETRVGIRFGSLMGDRRIRRSALGGGHADRDIPALARDYLEGRLLLEELVSERLALAGVNEALTATGKGMTVRSILLMNR
jgi:S-(hydroxymethyl)glutathione dehydrogenase/alcohol dehydrogenase